MITSSSSLESVRVVTQLTPHNLEDWKESLRRAMLPHGDEYAAVINHPYTLPSSALTQPHIDDLRKDGQKNDLPEFPKYKTVKRDPTTNDVVRDTAGNLIYVHSDVGFERHAKDVLEGKKEATRIRAVLGKINTAIVQSLSPQVEAILKASDPDGYIRALSDPTIMLKMIDEVVTQKDDANMITSLQNMIECRQTQFPDFHMWLSAFQTFVRIYTLKNNPQNEAGVKRLLIRRQRLC